MNEADLFADFDPLTGSPVFDNRPAPRRWLDALDEEPATLRQQTPPCAAISAWSGPITTQNPKLRHRPPQKHLNPHDTSTNSKRPPPVESNDEETVAGEVNAGG